MVMNKRNLMLVLGVVINCFSVFALNVMSSGAGELRELITDKNITELSISGTIDVRDMKFIADELSALKFLDISEAEIVAYSSNISYFDDVLEYDNNTLPRYCFFDKDYEMVKLPSSLKYIEEGAFGGCKELTEIILPAGLESIGDYAFSSCTSLKKVSLPLSVKHIGNGAFSRCSYLDEMDLSMLGGECFLGENVFANCTALEKVILSDKMIKIPVGAFAGCIALNSVETGAAPVLEEIGESAFESTSLTTFSLDMCTNIRDIGDYAFANTSLEEIHIPESVNNLGEGVFFYNFYLRNATIPQHLTELNGFIFSGAMSLNNVVLGGSMTSIGRYAFENNIAMTGMTVYAVTVPELEENVFDRVNQSTVVLRVPKESVDAYKSADQWKEFNVAGDMSTLEEHIDKGEHIKIYFGGDKLYVTANENIAIVEVYEPGGLLLHSERPCAETVAIDLYNTEAKIYIVFVLLENGKQKTVKLVK